MHAREKKKILKHPAVFLFFFSSSVCQVFFFMYLPEKRKYTGEQFLFPLHNLSPVKKCFRLPYNSYLNNFTNCFLCAQLVLNDTIEWSIWICTSYFKSQYFHTLFRFSSFFILPGSKIQRLTNFYFISLTQVTVSYLLYDKDICIFFYLNFISILYIIQWKNCPTRSGKIRF